MADAPELDTERLIDTLTRTDKLPAVDVALGIAAAGVLVVPVVPGGKDPLLSARHIRGVDQSSGEVVADACQACEALGLRPSADHGETLDPAVIRRYWSAHPDAGVGMKNHWRLVRGDGDFDDVASLKRARKVIGYGQPFGCPEAFEASTPGGMYRRRFLHLLPKDTPAPGGGTHLLGVSWYGRSGYCIVKGRHPKGGEYPPFRGVLTDLPEPVVLNLRHRGDGGGSAERQASSTEVSEFLAKHNGTGDTRRLAARITAVRSAEAGTRHHLLVTHLVGGLREAVAGYLPAAWLIDGLRGAVRDAGWDDARLGSEWNGTVAWAIGQVQHLTPEQAVTDIGTRVADRMEADAPPDDYDGRDLTPDELDALLVAHLAEVTGGEADDTRPARLSVESIPDPFVIPPLEWHARGLLVAPTYGELAGPEKSLKSYLGTAIDVGIASGLDVLGQWPSGRPQRVLVMVGEGGRNGFLRRLQRIVTAYGITIDDLRPYLRFCVETAPVSGERFRGTLTDELDAFQPALVHIDPWYSYAPAEVDARNLYEQGAALNNLGQLVASGNATLLINNHFNQTGAGGGLQRISMAGHAEWCDSWLLLSHRETPDVARGRFKLKLGVGSRQWGGAEWAVDFDIGRWDDDLNDHAGQLSWAVSTLNGASTDDADGNDEDRLSAARVAIVEAWKRRRGPHRQEPLSKSDWQNLVAGIGNTAKRKAFQQLEDDGRIRPVVVETSDRNGRTFSRQRFELALGQLEREVLGDAA